MKKIFIIPILMLLTLSSCSVDDKYDNRLHLHEFLHSFDLWHIDINQTMGNARIPMLSRAFTMTFHYNTEVTANNNLVGLGTIGNGYGLRIGRYNTSGDHLTISHDRDGVFHFKVVQISSNEIDLIDLDSDAVYRLIGYRKAKFDYNQLFFDNIAYFLQEYEFWQKSHTSVQGLENPFDQENFLFFFNNKGAYAFETKHLLYNSNLIGFGTYRIESTNFKDVKRLILLYGRDTEVFELRVINDQTIELYHLKSRTTYEFVGMRNIVFLKDKDSPQREKVQ